MLSIHEEVCEAKFWAGRVHLEETDCWSLWCGIRQRELRRRADSDSINIVRQLLESIAVRLEFGLGRLGNRSDLRLSTEFEKWCENPVSVLEIVVDDVHQEIGVHHFRDQLARRGRRFVDLCPLPSKFEGLILQEIPSAEQN
jgi:hypothetical protein